MASDLVRPGAGHGTTHGSPTSDGFAVAVTAAEYHDDEIADTPSLSNELELVYTVRVWLDGDDDPKQAEPVVRDHLEDALDDMQADGLIRHHELTTQ